MAGPVGCAYFLILECTFFSPNGPGITFFSEWTRYNCFWPLPILKIVRVVLDIQFSVGAAISLILHSFSIPTRVSDINILKIFFDFFPTLVIWNYGGKKHLWFRVFVSCLEIRVGGLFLLDLLWQRLSRSLSTAFGFWPGFMKTNFWLFSTFFFTWIYITHWK